MSTPDQTSRGDATADFDMRADNGRTVGNDPDTTQAPADETPAPAPTASTTAKSKATVIGDYKLLKKLGQGGMGVVYKALHQSLDREVAIKVLSKELANKPAFVHRFLREAKVMAKLDHPHILRCYDAGSAGSFHYLAIEFVHGGSAGDLLKRNGKLLVGDAVRIVLDCAAALDHAHQLNLIHRDIKPDNILFTKTGMVKLADLGLAKALDDDLSLTKTGTGAGTPLYMAPEQARDAKHVDHRADIYALGVMLYHFIVGEPPFKGATLVDVISAKEAGHFTPMRKFNAEVPPKLDLILDKLLAKDPKYRYESCAALFTDLNELGLANEHLSDFAEAAAADTATNRLTVTTTRSAAGKTMKPAVNTTAVADDAPIEADVWFVKMGTTVRRAMTPEVMLLIKTGKIDDTAAIGKTAAGPFRAVGTFPKFARHFKGKVAEDSTGNTGEAFKKNMAAIARQERWYKVTKFFRRFFAKATGLVSLLLWIAFLVGAGVGGYVLYTKYFQ